MQIESNKSSASYKVLLRREELRIFVQIVNPLCVTAIHIISFISQNLMLHNQSYNVQRKHCQTEVRIQADTLGSLPHVPSTVLCCGWQREPRQHEACLAGLDLRQPKKPVDWNRRLE